MRLGVTPNAVDSLIGARISKCKLHQVSNAADSLIGERFTKCKPHLPLIYQNFTKSRVFSSYSHVHLNFSPKMKPKRYFSLFLKLIAAVLLVPVVYVRLLYLNEVPYTLRKRLPILYPDHRERILEDKMLEIGEILPAAHPHSVKVRLILRKLVDALHRDLGFDGPPIVAGRIIIESNRSEISDKGLTESRRKIRGWRTDTSHLEGVNWQVVVVDKPEYEAYILAGGSIVVSSGLLDHHSDVEIDAVLAHEVGHIVARHLAEFMTVIFRVVYHNLSKYMDLRPLFVDMEIRDMHPDIYRLLSQGSDLRISGMLSKWFPPKYKRSKDITEQRPIGNSGRPKLSNAMAVRWGKLPVGGGSITPLNLSKNNSLNSLNLLMDEGISLMPLPRASRCVND